MRRPVHVFGAASLVVALWGSTAVTATPDPPVHDCDRLAADSMDKDAVAPPVSILQLKLRPAYAACDAAVTAFPGVPRFQAQMAQVYWALPNDEGKKMAVVWYRMAAEKGYPFAMAHYGMAFESSISGVTPDSNEAVKWLRAAAEKGSPLGKFYLGMWYITSDGKTLAEGIKLFQQAFAWILPQAQQGDPEAQNMAGAVYRFGWGATRDDPTAATWFRKAAEQGEAAAQTSLGMMYESGEGVKQDYNEALRWYREASNKGYSVAKTKFDDLSRRQQTATPQQQAQPQQETATPWWKK